MFSCTRRTLEESGPLRDCQIKHSCSARERAACGRAKNSSKCLHYTQIFGISVYSAETAGTRLLHTVEMLVAATEKQNTRRKVWFYPQLWSHG